jgi:hypothetical protein
VSRVSAPRIRPLQHQPLDAALAGAVAQFRELVPAGKRHHRRQVESGARLPRVPRFEPPAALGKSAATQVFRTLAENVVETYCRRKIALQFRGRGLAVQPLLQIVERRDLAVADHQELAVQCQISGHCRDNVRKGGADIVAGARIEAPFAAAGDQLHADPVPFPFGEIIARVEAREIGVLQRLGQHQRGKGRQIADLGRRMAPLQPIEERLVRRRESVPDFFDTVELDTAPFGERGLGEPRRDADPQLAGDEFQQCPTPRRIEGVEPRLEQPRHLASARFFQLSDDLGKAWDVACATRRGGPDQGDRLCEIADKVIGPGEQFGVDAGGGEGAHLARLRLVEDELAGQRS